MGQGRAFSLGSPAPEFSSLAGEQGCFSVYVDNWDQGKVVSEEDVQGFLGLASEQQQRLRISYTAAGVTRDPKKAAEGVLVWNTLGVQVRGAEGLVGARVLRRSELLAAILGLTTSEHPTELSYLGLLGKLIHALQLNRPLMSVLSRAFRPGAWRLGRPLTLEAAEELLTLAALLPCLWSSLRASVRGTVACTDASEVGGGACESVGLSPKGKALLEDLALGLTACASDVLLVSCFDPLGSASLALEYLGVTPAGIVGIEESRSGRAILRASTGRAITFPSLAACSPDELRLWKEWFPDVKVVIVYSGKPVSVSTNPGLAEEVSQVGRLLGWLEAVAQWRVGSLLMSPPEIKREEGPHLRPVGRRPTPGRYVGSVLCQRALVAVVAGASPAKQGVAGAGRGGYRTAPLPAGPEGGSGPGRLPGRRGLGLLGPSHRLPRAAGTAAGRGNAGGSPGGTWLPQGQGQVHRRRWSVPRDVLRA